MEETTFNNLVNGDIHPEDLMFNEKIKIFGDINLISNKKGD